MLPFQVLNMLNVCLASDSEARRLEPSYTKLNSIERHNFASLFVDVMEKLRKTKYTVWNIRLELRFSHKDDH